MPDAFGMPSQQLYKFTLSIVFVFNPFSSSPKGSKIWSPNPNRHVREKARVACTGKVQTEVKIEKILSQKRPRPHALVRLKIWSQHDTSSTSLQVIVANSSCKVESGGCEEVGYGCLPRDEGIQEEQFLLTLGQFSLLENYMEMDCRSSMQMPWIITTLLVRSRVVLPMD